MKLRKSLPKEISIFYDGDFLGAIIHSGNFLHAVQCDLESCSGSWRKQEEEKKLLWGTTLKWVMMACLSLWQCPAIQNQSIFGFCCSLQSPLEKCVFLFSPRSAQHQLSFNNGWFYQCCQKREIFKNNSDWILSWCIWTKLAIQLLCQVVDEVGAVSKQLNSIVILLQVLRIGPLQQRWRRNCMQCQLQTQ